MSCSRLDGDSQTEPNDQHPNISHMIDLNAASGTTSTTQTSQHFLPLFSLESLSSPRATGNPECGKAQLTKDRRCNDCEHIFTSNSPRLTCNDIIAHFCKRLLVIMETANRLNNKDFDDSQARLRKFCGLD